jgi:predicted RNase H-like HicB family nuclease
MVVLPQWDVRYWLNLVQPEGNFSKSLEHISTRLLAYASAGGQRVRLEEYIDLAITRAIFEEIEDEEPFYAEVPGLPGVWATGTTQYECRMNLRDVIDGWIEVRQRRGLQIPSINNIRLAD